jgi:hypothetical protein
VVFLVNDLSFHGQFYDLASFEEAMGRLMRIRELLKRFGREMHCHRNIAQAKVIPNMAMQQAIGKFSVDKRRTILSCIVV